jgi:ABC-type phosphate/phosphonate transport system permease subunit
MPLDSRSRIRNSIDSFRNTVVFLLVGVIGLGSTLLLSNDYLQGSPILMGILVFGMLVLVIVVLSFLPNILLLRKIKRYDRSIVQ